MRKFLMKIVWEVFDVSPAALLGSTIQFLAIFGLGKVAQRGCVLIDNPTLTSWCETETLGYVSNAVPAVILGLIVACVAVALSGIILALPIYALIAGIALAAFCTASLPQPFNYICGAIILVLVVIGYIAFVKWMTGGDYGDRGGKGPDWSKHI
ncbi:hypothetical protein [Bradyrhizobium sp. ERR14]|uniref:hypothetical protein n=1 Tax=Bradyrhizobium sp. ERR14 TaxID=2663837 RepID=UPI00160867E1|nr:hypothetical protein [Bradyrhizobium sp. ERR14]MBB4391797.1 hypothetical protein [Bradyrhizobium sp. ERR14]